MPPTKKKKKQVISQVILQAWCHKLAGVCRVRLLVRCQGVASLIFAPPLLLRVTALLPSLGYVVLPSVLPT